MANDSEVVFGCIGVALAVAAIIAVLYVLFFFVLPATAGLGALIGLGISGTNYVRAFVNNVRPEGDHDGTTAKIILGVVTFIIVAAIAVLLYLEA